MNKVTIDADVECWKISAIQQANGRHYRAIDDSHHMTISTRDLPREGDGSSTFIKLTLDNGLVRVDAMIGLHDLKKVLEKF